MCVQLDNVIDSMNIAGQDSVYYVHIKKKLHRDNIKSTCIQSSVYIGPPTC